MEPEPRVTYRRIIRLWLPLAATWLMMSIEGPFLAAVIARLPEPTVNLAAYGVAYAFALIVEAPIIMILSATTALATDIDAFRKLRNFLFSLNLIITTVMLVILWGPVFDWLMLDVISLPTEVARLTHRSLIALLPWPAAIGFRRFYQGLLIRQELTRRVAYGTAIRVVGMAGSALIFAGWLALPGALVGAAALSTGVVLESIGTRLMAWGIRRRIEARPGRRGEPLSYRRIVDFYIPLALTSILALAVHPTVTFFLGQSRQALESLAVLPVVDSLTFIFRSVALAYQEVAITLLDGTREAFERVSRFAAVLGIVSTAALVVIAFTPLAMIWFNVVSGLSAELAEFSLLPLRLFSLIPFFSVLLAFQRAIQVFGRNTRPVTFATIVEVTAIVIILFLGIRVFDGIGVIAAVSALFLGRVLGNLSLLYPGYLVLRSAGIVGSERAPAPVPGQGSRRKLSG
jgi:hypothetical protein